MKKVFLFLMACCLSLTMSAKVAYLVPGNSNDKSQIPAQWDNHTFEHTAYDWFQTNYVDKGLGDFINFTNIPSNTDVYSAIWIYIDREWKQQGEPWDEGRMDALFNDGVVNALKTYAQNGGDLFLGKQAARLAYRMGRIGYAPNYQCGGYSQDDRFWGIKAKLGSGLASENQRNRSDHAIYAGLTTATMDGVDGCFPLLNSMGDAHSTDNNIHWVEYWTPDGNGGWRKNPDNNGDPALIDGWESYWNARALGTWTSIGDYCIIQSVEFMPKDAFTGTILTINIGAYQWNSESTGDAADNMRKLTKNALYYLSGPEVIWTLTPGDAAVMEYKDAAHAVCNVDDAVVRYRSLDTDVIEINENTGALTYKAPAPEGVVVEAYVNVGGVEYKAQHTVHVFAPLADWTERPSKTDVLVGEDIVVKGKVRYGNAAFGFQKNDTYCDYSSIGENTYTLHFKHAGTTTIRPIATAYGVNYNNNETGGEEITFNIAPDLKWTTAPQSAFVGELGKKAIATTNEGEIVYSSSDPEKVSVDNEGNLTFLGYEVGGKVTITAKVTIDEKEYSISGELDANLPNVQWKTAPATEAYLNQVMSIQAELQWWTEHEVLYETSNCSYNAETGMLTITAGETATVRPYVVLSGRNYYGDPKAITVTTPVVTWTWTPGDAAVKEYKDPAQATCNVAGVEIRYRSLNTDVIEIDENTGALTYKKPSDEEGSDPYQGVIVEAYTTVNGIEYKDQHETKVYSPKADWVTRPAAPATVGSEVTISGKVRYGAAAFGFKTTGDECYTLSELAYDETEKVWKSTLRFTKDGTMTIRPKATAYEVDYENNEEGKGEAITITVTYAQEHPEISMETIPATVWDMFPVTLPAKLGDFDVTYSIKGTSASLEGNVLTYASEGSVELTAKYVESSSTAQWPAGDHTYTQTITMSGYGEAASGIEIAYLLPESLDELAKIEEKAEYNAAKWFMENYIGAGKKGKFVKDLSSLAGINTLWINVERVGITTEYAVLTNNAEAVANFVKAGGNVLLTKQATRLAYTSGRMPLEPNFEAGAYFEKAGENEGDKMFYRERSIATKMGIGSDVDKVADRSKNRLYNLMLYWDDSKNVYMVAPNVKKTNNYCGWQDLHKGIDQTSKNAKAPNTKIACLNEFEDAWKCEVLGVKGHIVDYCYADVVDFAPEGEYQGRIIAVGSSAYQWGETNRTAAANDAKEYKNVMQFTKNAIAYLHGDPEEEETYVRNATAGNYSTICYPFAIQRVEGATVFDLACMSPSGSSIVLEEVEYPLTPGKSYIFLPEENEVTFTYSGGCVEVIDHSNGMYGNLNAGVFQVPANEYNYILYKNSVYYVDSNNVQLQQYRAYIKLSEVKGYQAPATSEQAARRRTMGVLGAPSVTTEVENVDVDANDNLRKVMVNGQLYILRDGNMYNVQGQIVK